MDHTLLIAVGEELLEFAEIMTIFSILVSIPLLTSKLSSFLTSSVLLPCLWDISSGIWNTECTAPKMLSFTSHICFSNGLILSLTIRQETLVLSLIPLSTIFYHPPVHISVNHPILWNIFTFKLPWASINTIVL